MEPGLNDRDDGGEDGGPAEGVLEAAMEPGLNDRDDRLAREPVPLAVVAAMEPGLNDRDDVSNGGSAADMTQQPQWSPA